MFDKNLPEETAPAASSVGTKKRKSTAASSDERRTFDFTKEYRELRAHLLCATHKNRLCFVATPDGHHHQVELPQVSLWAKEIVRFFDLVPSIGTHNFQSVGNATIKRPPENIVFQDFFLPDRKKPRVARAESSNQCAPTIHVTVNTGASTAGNGATVSPKRRSPLATITNTDDLDIPTSLYRPQSHLFQEAESSDITTYPPVVDILQLIDNSGIFEDSAVLPFPAIVFADGLRDFQITRVDQVALLDSEFYVQQLNMPVQLAELLVEESIAAMGRLQKGKGRKN